MIEIIVTVLGLGACGGIYYLMNNRVKEAYENEMLAKGYQANAEEKVIEIQKKYTDFVTDAKIEMKEKVAKIEEKIKREADEKVQRVIKDYEEALKLETEGLEKRIEELDEELGDKIREVTEKNTLYFTCACDRGKQIPCSVDLSSDENYFTCDQCGAVYRIVINPSTVMMSGITNNPKIANMYDGVEVGEIDRTTL